MDLSGAYLMDGQHVLSQEHLRIAEDVAHMYNNLRLVWIPPTDRIPGTDDSPFGVRDMNTGIVVKTFPESMIQIIPKWLHENDSRRSNTYQSFLDEQAADKRARKAASDEAKTPKIDLAHAVLSSNLHTYRHNGIKYSDGGVEKI